MPTLVSYDTAPALVRELVATYRYATHRIDTGIALLKTLYQALRVPSGAWGTERQIIHDTIAVLEDLQHRMRKLERTDAHEYPPTPGTAPSLQDAPGGTIAAPRIPEDVWDDETPHNRP